MTDPASILALADVDAAIAYCLRHGEEVGAYWYRSEAEADALPMTIADEQPSPSRQELLARRPEQEKANAATGRR